MIMKDWNKLNDDDTKIGVEGEWIIKNRVLYLYITYTNHKRDVLSDCLIIPTLRGNHMGLQPFADWLRVWIDIKYMENEFDSITIFACSMGGGIAQILCNDLTIPINKAISIGGLNTTFKVHPKLELYINRGDLVPYLGLWFKRPKKKILNSAWQWPWKAHGTYDIEYLLKEYINA